MMGMGRLKAQGIPISNLADMLSRQLDKPVLDETGLTAKYDVSLNWTPEPGEGGPLMGLKMMAEHAAAVGTPPPGGAEGDPAAAAPPLPIALQQQLGLKLEPKKLPLEILVIDRVEKVPTEN